MGVIEEPREPLLAEGAADEFADLDRKPVSQQKVPKPPSVGGSTGRLCALGLDDQPMVSNLSVLPGQVIPARATIPIRRDMVGSDVAVLFDEGNPMQPIIVGVIQTARLGARAAEASAPVLSIEADDDRFVVNAEREIILRCGDASITLTRAGKIIIKGNYILSRSTGSNKIKGAAIDIN
jgi:hypothetical protein